MITIEIKKEDSIRLIRWKTIGNISHRYQGSTYIYWFASGQKSYELYLENGRLHRDPGEGPAYTSWNSDGQKKFDQYRVNGKLINLEDYDANN